MFPFGAHSLFGQVSYKVQDDAQGHSSLSVHPSTHTMPCVDSLTFANNKGGSGKTFLGFQFACEAARANPASKVLVVDLSLYSETSGILMGGLKRESALAPTVGRLRTVRFGHLTSVPLAIASRAGGGCRTIDCAYFRHETPSRAPYAALTPRRCGMM